MGCGVQLPYLRPGDLVTVCKRKPARAVHGEAGSAPLLARPHPLPTPRALPPASAPLLTITPPPPEPTPKASHGAAQHSRRAAQKQAHVFSPPPSGERLLFIAVGTGALLVLGASACATVRSGTEAGNYLKPRSLVHQHHSMYAYQRQYDEHDNEAAGDGVAMDRYERAWAHAADRQQRTDILL